MVQQNKTRMERKGTACSICRQVGDVTDEDHAYRWMRTKGLKLETWALITAAREQALSTKQHQTKILHSSKDSKCRMCKTANEPATHILAGCPKLAERDYLKRHKLNAAAAVVHRRLCQ